MQRTNNPTNVSTIEIGHSLSGTISATIDLNAYSFTGNPGDELIFQAAQTMGSADLQLRVYRPEYVAL